MSSPKKKITDLQRNWNIAKRYVKESPSLPNILKALKYLLDGPSKYITGQPEILPGFQVKSLMTGNQLEHQLSKIGSISTNAVKALANKSSKFEGTLLNRVIDSVFPTQKAVNYDLLRKAVQKELIQYRTKPSSKYLDYGIDRLKFDVRPSPFNTRFNPQTGQFEAHVVKPQVFTFESDRIPIGNAKHYDATTLGHTRAFSNPDEPGILNIIESQSDWAQNPWRSSTYNKMAKKAPHRLESLRKQIAMMKERNIPTQEVEVRLSQPQQFLDVPAEHIKHLQDTYIPRQLQENMLYASKYGYTTMRYPTPSTAIKVEGYEPKLLFKDKDLEKKATEMMQHIEQIEYKLAQGQNPRTYRKLSRELDLLKQQYEVLKQQSTGELFTPSEQTIIKKYEDFPKIYNKLFKQQPRIVEDSKGNSWFEFNIPNNMQTRELQYKKGGSL